MTINPQTILFLQSHRQSDPIQLLLQSHKHPQVNMSWVADQIEGQRQAQHKWPILAQNTDLWFPPKLNREQSSSQTTAQWHTQLIPPQSTLADLTGGMGIDTLFFAQQASHVHYIELNPDLCQLAQHNFQTLNLSNITIHQTDSLLWLSQTQQQFHTLYIDPARRDSNGHKVAAFESSTPNLLPNLSLLLSHCQQLIIKASPMISIPTAIQQLPNLQRIIILAIKGECKEVLFICTQQSTQQLTLSCHNLLTTQPPLQFTPNQEQSVPVTYATTLNDYLYEPNAAIMKAGAYNTIANTYQIQKLARNTHLYTSSQLIPNFPGRIFKIQTEIKPNPKAISQFIPTRKAHVISRNHPIPAPTLQQKLKLHEGGEQYIIATTIASKPITLLCTQII